MTKRQRQLAFHQRRRVMRANACKERAALIKPSPPAKDEHKPECYASMCSCGIAVRFLFYSWAGTQRFAARRRAIKRRGWGRIRHDGWPSNVITNAAASEKAEISCYADEHAECANWTKEMEPA
jgi:hypothetical protein